MSKLAADAIRIYSYQLARDLLQRAVEAVSEAGSEDGRGDSAENEEIQVKSGVVGMSELERQLEEKDALIKQLKEQVEALQQEVASINTIKPEPEFSKRKLRSLHQIKEANVKVNEEEVAFPSDTAIPTHKSLHSRNSPEATPPAAIEKTPSLRDLEVSKQEEAEKTDKPNIFNVEYEEFAQQIKLELGSSPPPDSQQPPSDYISPDFFRYKEAKAVLNWSNLQSPQCPASPPADSLALKEAERPILPSAPSIWTDMKPKSRGKPVRPVIPRPIGAPITLERKLRAKSQVHSSRPGDISRDSDFKPVSRGRRSTPGSKGVSPRAAAVSTMNKTTIEGNRPRKGSQGSRNRPEELKRNLDLEAKPLESLLSEASDARNWAELMQEMKENPAYLSELLTPVPCAPPPRLVFRRSSHSHRPIPGILPSNGLNSVQEEDEDSYRSHYDPVPELNSSKGSMRSEGRGPMLPTRSRKYPSSVPKSRPKPTDWSDSPLDAFALGGNMAFNWDRRSGIYSEKEADSTFYRLHSHPPDPHDIPLIYSKAVTTITRLLDELLLPRDYIPQQGSSMEGTIYALRQIKRLLEYRRLTIKILKLIHHREDQMLTMMSLEEGTESGKLAETITATERELEDLLGRWKQAGFPHQAFMYLGIVRARQDYAARLQREL